MATWDDVRAAVMSLPETEEGEAYGYRAWRIHKKLIAWERPLRKTDLAALGADAPRGDILGLATADVFEKEALIAMAPEVFFTTPHFDGHSVVLARLDALPLDELTRLVREAWLRHAPKRLVRSYTGTVTQPPVRQFPGSDGDPL